MLPDTARDAADQPKQPAWWWRWRYLLLILLCLQVVAPLSCNAVFVGGRWIFTTGSTAIDADLDVDGKPRTKIRTGSAAWKSLVEER